MWQKAYQRTDLYTVLDSVQDTTKLGEMEARFHASTLSRFRRNGMGKPREEQEAIAKLAAEISDLSTAFETNVNEDVTEVELTRDELVGLSDDFCASLKKGRLADTLRVASIYPPSTLHLPQQMSQTCHKP